MVFLNGQFVPDEHATVSVLDRGFLYGDGLFETVLAQHGRLFRWEQHWQRLAAGAAFLRLRLPFDGETLHAAARRLLELNETPDASVRLTVSRGVGLRGYSPKGAEQPTTVLATHPLPFSTSAGPPTWRLITASLRLMPGDPLARFKTANKLVQVLARAEAEERGVEEALLLNTAGQVAETASGNVAWIVAGAVCTPPLAAGLLPGVTRAVLAEICAAAGIPFHEQSAEPMDLLRADGVLVTLTTLGVVAVGSLDGQRLANSPLAAELAAHYGSWVDRETRERV